MLLLYNLTNYLDFQYLEEFSFKSKLIIIFLPNLLNYYIIYLTNVPENKLFPKIKFIFFNYV